MRLSTLEKRPPACPLHYAVNGGAGAIDGLAREERVPEGGRAGGRGAAGK